MDVINPCDAEYLPPCLCPVFRMPAEPDRPRSEAPQVRRRGNPRAFEYEGNGYTIRPARNTTACLVICPSNRGFRSDASKLAARLGTHPLGLPAGQYVMTPARAKEFIRAMGDPPPPVEKRKGTE